VNKRTELTERLFSQNLGKIKKSIKKYAEENPEQLIIYQLEEFIRENPETNNPKSITKNAMNRFRCSLSDSMNQINFDEEVFVIV